MNYNNFSLEKINEIPVISWEVKDEKEYNSVIIVPMDEIHESGYRRMTFLFCQGEEIICRSNGSSDVLRIDGICGYGDLFPDKIPTALEPRAWAIDCLPNGYLRLFCSNGRIKNGNGLSDYDIFAKIKHRRCER